MRWRVGVVRRRTPERRRSWSRATRLADRPAMNQPNEHRWDDLWLNEGFACWMQTYAADCLYPEWGLWEQFIVNDQQAALRLDSLRSSHPIQASSQLAVLHRRLAVVLSKRELA